MIATQCQGEPEGPADSDLKPSRRDGPSRVGFVLWLLALVAGASVLSAYGARGAMPAAAVAWSGGLEAALHPDRPSLFFFLHPRCPCSAASLAELRRVLSRFPDAFAVTVVVTVPPGNPPGWRDGRAIESARTLPGASLIFDPGGATAARFGAGISGTALAFRPDGARLFAGGVTVARGHEGASAGSLALAAIAAGRAPERAELPVFGCPLVLPGTLGAGGP